MHLFSYNSIFSCFSCFPPPLLQIVLLPLGNKKGLHVFSTNPVIIQLITDSLTSSFAYLSAIYTSRFE